MALASCSFCIRSLLKGERGLHVASLSLHPQVPRAYHLYPQGQLSVSSLSPGRALGFPPPPHPKSNIKRGTGKLSLFKTGPCHRWSSSLSARIRKIPRCQVFLPFQNHLHPSFRIFVKMPTPGPGVPPLWPRACLAQGPRFPPRCVCGGARNCRIGLRKLGVKLASNRQTIPFSWSRNWIFPWEWSMASARVKADRFCLADL